MKHYYEEIGALPPSKNVGVSYVVGFILSLLCTIGAYLSVTLHVFDGRTLIAALVMLALVQCTTQAICFLHIDMERRSRLKLLILCFAMLVVSILVSGSLWIMFNLNGRMMPTQADMEQYMQDQDGL